MDRPDPPSSSDSSASTDRSDATDAPEVPRSDAAEPPVQTPRGKASGGGASEHVDEPELENGAANRRIPLILVAAAAFGLLAGIAAVALLRDDGGRDPSQEVAERLVVQGPVIPALVPGEPDPALGEIAPVLDGDTITGEPIIVGVDGRPRLLVFFSHWCAACEDELALVVDLQQRGVFAGIDVIGVSTAAQPDEPNYPPSAWLEELGWPYPTVVDTEDGVAARAYGTADMPYFVFVHPDGTIAARASGPVPADRLTEIARAFVEGRLAPPAPPPEELPEGEEAPPDAPSEP